jgi:hypothetical protein
VCPLTRALTNRLTNRSESAPCFDLCKPCVSLSKQSSGCDGQIWETTPGVSSVSTSSITIERRNPLHSQGTQKAPGGPRTVPAVPPSRVVGFVVSSPKGVAPNPRVQHPPGSTDPRYPEHSRRLGVRSVPPRSKRTCPRPPHRRAPRCASQIMLETYSTAKCPVLAGQVWSSASTRPSLQSV